ncbi:MAG TPA: hypothetical protein VF625_01005 [Longimicrobium sp.]|jgi:hypothetical protein
MKMRWIGVVAASLTAGCAPTMRSAPAPVEATDAAVYATVLDLFAGGPIVLVDSLDVVDAGGDVYGAVSRVAGKTLADDLVRRGSDSRVVPASLPTRNAVRIIRGRDVASRSPDDLEALWREFSERHPGAAGYFQVSAVGYDRDATRAVLYVGHRCGMLCMQGYIMTLAREGNGWKVLDYPILWEA